MTEFQHGDVAQMVERSLCMREVQGSIPCISNLFSLRFIFSSQTTLSPLQTRHESLAAQLHK